MVDYDRNANNQIQANLAGRINEIARQYATLDLKEQERFDATLHICLLQTLLTSCNELMKFKIPKAFEKEYSISPIWKVQLDILENTFYSSKTIKNKDILTHIRDALSHPVVAEYSELLTGYTTEKDESSGQIVAFVFTSSPDKKNDTSIKTYLSEQIANEALRTSKGFPKGVKPHQIGERCFQLYTFEADKPLKPYVRIFRVKIDVENIKLLVTKLSEFLSQQK